MKTTELSDRQKFKFVAMSPRAEEVNRGSALWVASKSYRLQYAFDKISTDTSTYAKDELLDLLTVEPAPWDVFPEDKPCGTPDAYADFVLGRSFDAVIKTVVDLLEDRKAAKALERAADAALARARGKVPVDKGGRPPTETVDRVNGLGRRDYGGGNSKSYLADRLARERPDLLEQYERGEIKSIKAAARAAGIVKEPPLFDRVVKLLTKALPRLTDAQKRQLREMLDHGFRDE